MPRNEDGELELILGNRQLLSVFFIMMILLGVFFTVGYVVGRNSAPVVAADTSSSVRAESKPLVVESAAPRQPDPAPVTEPAPGKPITTAVQQPPDAPKSQPAKQEPRPEAKAEPPKSEKAKKEVAKSEPAKAPPASGDAAPGTYLQLSATQKAEAEVMVDVLRKKGFRAVAASVPDKPGLYRVLVGPLGDGSVGQTRAELQSAGFPGDKAIRKTF